MTREIHLLGLKITCKNLKNACSAGVLSHPSQTTQEAIRKREPAMWQTMNCLERHVQNLFAQEINSLSRFTNPPSIRQKLFADLHPLTTSQLGQQLPISHKLLGCDFLGSRSWHGAAPGTPRSSRGVCARRSDQRSCGHLAAPGSACGTPW